MNNERLKIVFPILKKVIEEIMAQEINSPNVVVAWAMTAGKEQDVTLEEAQYVLDMKVRDYIQANKGIINEKSE